MATPEVEQRATGERKVILKIERKWGNKSLIFKVLMYSWPLITILVIGLAIVISMLTR